jgi:hypothetical protein
VIAENAETWRASANGGSVAGTIAKIAKMSFYSDDSVYPGSKSKLVLFFAIFVLLNY